jgi:Tfp pilus assembly protein PilN
MPNINLIAERRQEKRRMERLSKQLFFTLGGSLAIFVAVGSYLLTARISQFGEVAEAEQRMEKLKPVIAEIDLIKKETADKEPKLATLEQARYDTLRWTLLFQSISESLPAQVWLSNLGAPDGEPVVVNLSGSAPTQTIASQLVLNLKKQPIFDKVEIPTTTRMEKENRFSFQITAQLKPIIAPKAVAPPPAGDGKKTAQAEANQGEKAHA